MIHIWSNYVGNVWETALQTTTLLLKWQYYRLYITKYSRRIFDNGQTYHGVVPAMTYNVFIEGTPHIVMIVLVLKTFSGIFLSACTVSEYGT